MPHRSLRRLATALALALAAFAVASPAPAFAQSAAAAREATSVAVGLSAQFEAALIRERRLADDRELTLITEAETRLRQARANFDARISGAQRELERARADYAALCAQVTQREAAVRVEIEAYRAEALGIAQRATPERLEALQRFADGDRVGAWPVIEELMQASVRARMAAAAEAAAAEVREAADLRAIMRGHGEATSAQVLALFDQAASLDPRHLETHLHRSVLLQDLGALPQARAAAEAAHALATSDDQQYSANIQIGRIALTSGDLTAAKTAFEADIPFLRARVAATPTGEARRDLIIALNNLGDVLTRQGDPNGAYRNYHEALGLTLQLSREEPDSILLQLDITLSNDRIGDLFYADRRYDIAGAIFEENLAFRRALVERAPTSLERRLALCVSLERMGDIRVEQRNFVAARALFEESRAIRAAIAAADPSSAEHQSTLSLITNKVGDTYREENNLPEARTRYETSLAIRRRLAAADPTNALFARDVASSLQRVGLVANLQNDNAAARAAWDEALAIFQDLLRRDPSNVAFQGYVAQTERLLARLAPAPPQ